MKKVLSLFLVFGLIVGGLSGCGSSKKENNSGNQSNKKEYVKESDFPKVYANPEKYEGKYIRITGKIFQNPEKDENGTYFQMWGDIENSDWNTIVGINDTTIELSNNDFVSIDGEIAGTQEGENAFGGTVSALVVKANKVEKISYQDAVSPTIKEINTNGMINSQNGVDISVTKVEFAKNETRVYYTVTNNSGSKYSFYDFNIKLIQNGKQYDEQTNYDADYNSVSGDILNGVSSDGIIAFPPIEQANFEIHFDSGYSDNYDLDFTEINFTIEYK